MNITYENNDVIITGLTDLNIADTLDCGQCFRWNKLDDESFFGVVGNKTLSLLQPCDDTLVLKNTSESTLDFWLEYFDLNRDYKKIKDSFLANETLAKACDYAGGIRILKQDPFETLISFIISQNNNIKRIKGIIEKLCQNFGEQLSDNIYAFPTPARIANLSIDELDVIKSGFRAKYILDAAQKIHSSEVSLESIYKKSLDEARTELTKIKGVGPKVSDCICLFGFAKLNSFPKDVWIKRVLDVFFEGEIPACALEYGGIAQQYLFHYARCNKELFESKLAQK